HGEVLLRKRVTEEFVVDPVVLADDSALRDAGGAAGLEDVDRAIRVRLRHPPAYRPAAQPFVLALAELAQVGKTVHVLQRVEAEGLRAFEPEGSAGFGVKVGLHDLTDVSVKLLAGLCGCHGHEGSASPNRMYQLRSACLRMSSAARK